MVHKKQVTRVRVSLHVLILLLCLAGGWMMVQPARACSTLLVGLRAAGGHSVLMASSCDGDVMGVIRVMPARSYPPDTVLPMLWNIPRPTTYQEYQTNLTKGYDVVGSLPVTQTFRSIVFGGNLESMTTGGLNEHGVSIAIEFLPMRKELVCDKGVVGPNSNHWTTSLIANGLLRAKTAREAIQVIGRMVDQYGFLYYRAPSAGVALPIADGTEVWLMEIFGPGKDWTPGNGKPGGVWCAQRVPDGEVGCSANRSRISNVNIEDSDHFIASANVFSLAQELGLSKGGKPFVWHDVYGGPGGRSNSLREWRALSLLAPSLKLKVTGDPAVDRYPFSVKPDELVDVPALMRVMRDTYEGTRFDLTEHSAFRISKGKSPLACPWGPGDVCDLLDIHPERALCTSTSGYVFIAQLRSKMPPAIGNCLWFAYGPANTSCFVPIYAGVSDLPNAWDHAADFTRIDRTQPQWNFRLVHNLATRLRYQDAIQDIQHVVVPAEKRFLKLQADFEKTAVAVLNRRGPGELQAMLNDVVEQNLVSVGHSYHDLVDYLMLKYLVGDKALAPPRLPRIEPVVVGNQ